MGSFHVTPTTLKYQDNKMSANVFLVILSLAMVLHQTTGGFFSDPADECQRDYDCPRFGHRSGKCVTQKRGIFCGTLNPNRKCSYKVCAECLVNRDCAGLGERYCAANRCFSAPNIDRSECQYDSDCFVLGKKTCRNN